MSYPQKLQHNRIALTEEGLENFVKEIQKEEKKRMNMKKFNFLRKLTKKEHHFNKKGKKNKGKRLGLMQSVVNSIGASNAFLKKASISQFPSLDRMNSNSRLLQSRGTHLLQNKSEVPQSPLRKRKTMLIGSMNLAFKGQDPNSRRNTINKPTLVSFGDHVNNLHGSIVLQNTVFEDERENDNLRTEDSPSKNSIGNFSLNTNNMDQANEMSPFKIPKHNMAKKKSGFALSLIKANDAPTLKINQKNAFSQGLSHLVKVTDEVKKNFNLQPTSPDPLNQKMFRVKSLHLINKKHRKTKSLDYEEYIKMMKERRKESMKKYHESKEKTNKVFRDKIKKKAQRNINLRCSLGNMGAYGFDYSFWRHFKEYEIKEVKRDKRKSLHFEEVTPLKDFDKKFRNKHFARTFNKSSDKDVLIDMNQTNRLKKERRDSHMRKSIPREEESSVPIEYDMVNEFDDLINKGHHILLERKIIENKFEKKYSKIHSKIGERIGTNKNRYRTPPFFDYDKNDYQPEKLSNGNEFTFGIADDFSKDGNIKIQLNEETFRDVKSMKKSRSKKFYIKKKVG